MVNDYDRPSACVIIKMWRLVLVTNWTRTVTYQRKRPNSYSFLMSLSDGPCDFTNGKDWNFTLLWSLWMTGLAPSFTINVTSCTQSRHFWGLPRPKELYLHCRSTLYVVYDYCKAFVTTQYSVLWWLDEYITV